ncbi:MAG: hypothetical protein JXB30_08395, partial [Anaerolineae bacterium]|nr:hypothetical protein [Anaerolineae bacterium]
YVLDNKASNDWIIAWSLQQSVFQSSISNHQLSNNLTRCSARATIGCRGPKTAGLTGNVMPWTSWLKEVI